MSWYSGVRTAVGRAEAIAVTVLRRSSVKPCNSEAVMISSCCWCVTCASKAAVMAPCESRISCMPPATV
eukprot:4781821-Heterocapsa_arctica.AAC.1